MNTITASTLSAEAKEHMLCHRGEPFLLAAWHNAVFLHFAVPPEQLQSFVPFPLDVRDGMAYVSCVAFTMRDMRPRMGGAWLFKPIATHEFLNVRTYVRQGKESGIYFLAEWLPNRLSVMLGPTVFGLPYRLGRVRYDHRTDETMRGVIEDGASNAVLRYSATPMPDIKEREAEAGSLDEFLLERYTAFTRRLGMKRLFRVWHPAWRAIPLQVELHDVTLLKRTGEWADYATFVGAHFARGFNEVWMGRPRFVVNRSMSPVLQHQRHQPI